MIFFYIMTSSSTFFAYFKNLIGNTSVQSYGIAAYSRNESGGQEIFPLAKLGCQNTLVKLKSKVAQIFKYCNAQV